MIRSYYTTIILDQKNNKDNNNINSIKSEENKENKEKQLEDLILTHAYRIGPRSFDSYLIPLEPLLQIKNTNNNDSTNLPSLSNPFLIFYPPKELVIRSAFLDDLKIELPCLAIPEATNLNLESKNSLSSLHSLIILDEKQLDFQLIDSCINREQKETEKEIIYLNSGGVSDVYGIYPLLPAYFFTSDNQMKKWIKNNIIQVIKINKIIKSIALNRYFDKVKCKCSNCSYYSSTLNYSNLSNNYNTDDTSLSIKLAGRILTREFVIASALKNYISAFKIFIEGKEQPLFDIKLPGGNPQDINRGIIKQEYVLGNTLYEIAQWIVLAHQEHDKNRKQLIRILDQQLKIHEEREFLLKKQSYIRHKYKKKSLKLTLGETLRKELSIIRFKLSEIKKQEISLLSEERKIDALARLNRKLKNIGLQNEQYTIQLLSAVVAAYRLMAEAFAQVTQTCELIQLGNVIDPKTNNYVYIDVDLNFGHNLIWNQLEKIIYIIDW